MTQLRQRTRTAVAVCVAVVVFAILAKPIQIILSLTLVILFAIVFGDSAEVAANAEATAKIAGLILALLAAYGTYRLIAKSRKADPSTAAQNVG